MNVFDRRAVRLHRDRSARLDQPANPLVAEVADRLLERLDDVRRTFPEILELGCRGLMTNRLASRDGIKRVVRCDLSEPMLRRGRGPTGVEFPAVVADEEFLPFAPTSFDLVISSLSLHWVNDLPGALVQIRRCLRPDGLFLAALFGGETLSELAVSFLAAEAEQESGASPRTSPFADAADLGALMQRAGFALPVIDQDTIALTYAEPFSLMRDLRELGETNATHARRKAFTRRGTLFAMAERYRSAYADGEGRIPATFRIVYLTGWAPHDSQPGALRPGSAATRLADALGTREMPAGDKAAPRKRD